MEGGGEKEFACLFENVVKFCTPTTYFFGTVCLVEVMGESVASQGN